jgi:hypothetical protein
MSKKLKITEDQLKRLIVLKEEDETMDFEEPSMEIPTELGADENSDNELDRMVDSFIRQYKEKAIQGVDEDMVNGLCDKIRQGLGGEESQSEYEMPGYQETMDNLNNLSIREDDDMVNESVKKIKSTFKRFL